MSITIILLVLAELLYNGRYEQKVTGIKSGMDRNKGRHN